MNIQTIFAEAVEKTSIATKNNFIPVSTTLAKEILEFISLFNNRRMDVAKVAEANGMTEDNMIAIRQIVNNSFWELANLTQNGSIRRSIEIMNRAHEREDAKDPVFAAMIYKATCLTRTVEEAALTQETQNDTVEPELTAG